MKKIPWFLVLLIGWTIVLRLLPVFPNKFSFMYDNAKDSLVIRQMGKHHKPALFGAVTSIDGVYNGPLWYYLALPLNFLLDYHPLASVLTVVILSVISVGLVYLYLGRLTALLYATSVGLIGTQQSAWTPYMTPLVVLPILLILLKLPQLGLTKKVFTKRFKKTHQHQPVVQLWLSLVENSSWLYGCLGLLVGFSFHFQTAYGMVLLPTVLLCLLLLRWRSRLQLGFKNLLILLTGFVFTFTPFVIFELRHDWHQTKQIIAFLQDYQQQAQAINANQSGWGRVLEIGQYIYDSAWQAVLPVKLAPAGLVIIGLIGGYFWQQLTAQHRKTSQQGLVQLIVFLSFVLTPLLLYQFLPCKAYYLVALLPVWIVFFALALKNFLDNKWLKLIILLVIVLSGYQLANNYSWTNYLTEQASFPYLPKQQAVNKVYELSNGQSFASYHFVKEVYDYTYQQIYLSLIDQGYEQPVEFSYLPGKTAYIPQKRLLVKKSKPPAQVFLIVEEYYSEAVFQDWWWRVTQQLEIVNSYPINQSIVVYQARLL
ncbi:MAG: hypothetical protein GF390_02905 [Candidatus Pacebacteria bacterium]|nr:hypothetical protein [Candidatus Paceibacterota bacterium]